MPLRIKKPLLFIRLHFRILYLSLLLKFLGTRNLLARIKRKGIRLLPNRPQGEIDRVICYTDFILHQWPYDYKKSCLVRSLILYSYFKPIYSNLKIVLGIRKDSENGLTGHCWLEEDNQVMFDLPNFSSAGYFRMHEYTGT